MKKIFAIALAVVMVLSMASAFALNACTTWGTNWSCTADATLCGKGSVEVVPYVKVNTSCGWAWQVSDCAAAIKTEKVYYAVKLTVDENPDPDWWEPATLTIEAEGLVNPVELDEAPIAVPEAGEYYLAQDLQSWYDLEDWDDLTAVQQDAYIFEATVDANVNVCDPSEFSVCAILASYYNGYSFVNAAGDYEVEFASNNGAPMFNADEEFNGFIKISDEDNEVVLTVVDGAIVTPNWANASATFFNTVMAEFGFNACGTAACITMDNIEANFGWDDELKDCFDWSDKGASVVDTDCVVAIPKTGDASVLAWLF